MEFSYSQTENFEMEKLSSDTGYFKKPVEIDRGLGRIWKRKYFGLGLFTNNRWALGLHTMANTVIAISSINVIYPLWFSMVVIPTAVKIIIHAFGIVCFIITNSIPHKSIRDSIDFFCIKTSTFWTLFFVDTRSTTITSIKVAFSSICRILTVKSLTSKATSLATQFFKRSYKVSHNCGF